ncbi:hypothetical protein C8J56DRAFT_727605, partial [Mycena floridula]
MYGFCKGRGLWEVWGYMWTSWYSPKVWKLWSRSSSPYLSRLRTTMTIENFWRQLKYDHLHHITHPRLDQLVWILIYEVNPGCLARSELLTNEHRLGRSRKLTTFQKAFKKNWHSLMKVSVSGKEYTTDTVTWTCNCGQQKYNMHHLCKHLVRAVPAPSIKFWQQVSRRRTSPLYRHPELQRRENGDLGEYIEPNGGNITDGDDQVWTGDAEMLKG